MEKAQKTTSPIPMRTKTTKNNTLTVSLPSTISFKLDYAPNKEILDAIVEKHRSEFVEAFESKSYYEDKSKIISRDLFDLYQTWFSLSNVNFFQINPDTGDKEPFFEYPEVNHAKTIELVRNYWTTVILKNESIVTCYFLI